LRDLSGDSNRSDRVLVHPVIRVATLVAVALLVPHVQIIQLLPLGAVLLYIYGFRLTSDARQKALGMLFKLRWFFISILFVYGWLTADPLSATGRYWLWPDVSGLLAGCKQLLALTVIVLSVNVLLSYSRREELLQAIYWLARPLCWFGLSRERLAVRLMLVLDRASDVRSQLAHSGSKAQLDSSQPATAKSWQSRWVSLSTVLNAAVLDALKSVESVDEDIMEFTPLSAPAAYQWGLPVLIIPVLLMLPYK